MELTNDVLDARPNLCKYVHMLHGYNMNVLCVFRLGCVFTGDKWMCALSCLGSLSVPLKTSKKLWFSEVFRWYRKRPVA